MEMRTALPRVLRSIRTSSGGAVVTSLLSDDGLVVGWKMPALSRGVCWLLLLNLPET